MATGMTKQEFLDQLGRALASRAGGSVVNENLSYYEEYIAAQVRAGRNEAEVIEELGDPRLLARSICEAQKRAGNAETEQIYEEDAERSTAIRRVRMPGWLLLVLIILAVVFIAGAVFSILGALLPILIPAALVIFFLRMIQSK